EVLDKKSITFDKREVSLEKREESLAEKQQQIEEMESKVEATLAEQHTELERISGYTTDQAKQVILTKLENDLKQQTEVMIKEAETRSKEEEDKKAKHILSLVLMRSAADDVNITTISVIYYPNFVINDKIHSMLCCRLSIH